MTDMIKILCVDDEKNVLKALRRLFIEEDSYEIFLAESGAEGLEVLEEEENIRMVISDYRMPEMTGVDFLAQVNEKWPETMRIVLSGYADTAAVVEAINQGQIYKFIPKPWNDEELLSTIASALEHQDMRREIRNLNAELQKKNTELQEINENLEELVKKRTEALDIRNQVLQISQGILDTLPVVVFGIDQDGMIVSCNEFARELFPYDGIGPLGNDRNEVFPAAVNGMIDKLKTEPNPKEVLEIQKQKFYGEVKKLDEDLSDGVVLILVPKHED